MKNQPISTLGKSMRPCQSVVLRGICISLSEASLFSSNANLYATTACEKRQSVQLIGDSQGLTSKLFLSLIDCILLSVFPASHQCLHRKLFICSGHRGDTQAQGSVFVFPGCPKKLLQTGQLKTAAIHSLTVPETTSPKTKVLAGLCTLQRLSGRFCSFLRSTSGECQHHSKLTRFLHRLLLCVSKSSPLLHLIKTVVSVLSLLPHPG